MRASRSLVSDASQSSASSLAASISPNETLCVLMQLYAPKLCAISTRRPKAAPSTCQYTPLGDSLGNTLRGAHSALVPPLCVCECDCASALCLSVCPSVYLGHNTLRPYVPISELRYYHHSIHFERLEISSSSNRIKDIISLEAPPTRRIMKLNSGSPAAASAASHLY